MFQAITFALALDVTALFQYWRPHNILLMFWTEAVIFTLIAISSVILTLMLVRANYIRYQRRRIK